MSRFSVKNHTVHLFLQMYLLRKSGGDDHGICGHFLRKEGRLLGWSNIIIRALFSLGGQLKCAKGGRRGILSTSDWLERCCCILDNHSFCTMLPPPRYSQTFVTQQKKPRLSLMSSSVYITCRKLDLFYWAFTLLTIYQIYIQKSY